METQHISTDELAGRNATTAFPFWVPILSYHRILPEVPSNDLTGNCLNIKIFERQLQWLVRRRYNGVSLERLASCFASSPSSLLQTLPSRPVVITFDDGYADNYEYAWPLLKRYGFTATIFLVTGAIGGTNVFDSGFDLPPVPMLSLLQIQEMQMEGISFGSHTVTHPPTLTTLSDAELKMELERARQSLQRLVNPSFLTFAYPHSKLDARVERAVQQAGYAIACGGVGTRLTRFCLHRIDPGTRTGLHLDLHFQERNIKYFLRNRLCRKQNGL